MTIKRQPYNRLPFILSYNNVKIILGGYIRFLAAR